LNPYAFDTLTVDTGARTDEILAAARAAGANLRKVSTQHVGVALDETTTRADIAAIWGWFAAPGVKLPSVDEHLQGLALHIPEALRRTSAFLTHPVFNTHHSE